MLVKQPFQKEYAFAQQGSYLISQKMFGIQQAVVKHNQFRPVVVQGYQALSAEKVQARKPGLGCNTHLDTYRSNGFCRNKARFVYGSSAGNGCVKSELFSCNDSGKKRKVFAFGPKHAEHARRFYQLKNVNPQLEQVLVAPCRYNYGPMQIQYEQTQVRGYLSGTRKLDGAVSSVVASEPYETVLKVANISPMPDKKLENKPETLFGFLENGHNENVDQVNAKKSIDFLDNEDEIDLSNAPIFQILCEIIEMY